MQIPERLRDMIAEGLIQEVLRPLKSGKEAAVFVVVHEGVERAAKVYKSAERRNFRARADYVEGRRVGDSRQQRAMDKGSRFGRQKNEEAWQRAEADAMSKMHAAGLRVPRLYLRDEGVLVMDLVRGRDGGPATQIAATRFSRDEALRFHAIVIRQVVGMLCVGLVHGDLSEFNLLHAVDGPMVIDLPQAVQVERNNNAKRLLLRDVANVTRFFSRFAPELRRSDYGQEMWLLHEHHDLKPDSPLTGRVQRARQAVDTNIILREIEAAKREAAHREEVSRWRADKGKRP